MLFITFGNINFTCAEKLRTRSDIFVSLDIGPGQL
jgi:hypothetical protein